MLIFLDSCDVKEIEELVNYGLVDGITTNPSLVHKSGANFFDLLKAICEIVPTSVSAEVVATDYKGMLKEAETLLKISSAITVKLPMTFDGLKVCKEVHKMNGTTNVTLCFSSAQALLAAKAQATYVSPFVGRLDDIGDDGMGLVAEIKSIYENYPEFQTKVLVASVRSVNHVIEAAKLGADVITVPPSILRQMINHPLTDKGLEIFTRDWHETGQTI
jgi:transaldolase